MNQENNQEPKKERGPKHTVPDEIKTPKNSTFSSWSKSIEGSLKHLKIIKEEAEKAARINGYTPKIKIGKRFKHYFNEEVIEAKKRTKRKKQREQNGQK